MHLQVVSLLSRFRERCLHQNEDCTSSTGRAEWSAANSSSSVNSRSSEEAAVVADRRSVSSRFHYTAVLRSTCSAHATSLPQPHSLLLALCSCALCMFLVLLVHASLWTAPRPIVPFFILPPSTSTHHQSCWLPVEWEGRSYIPTRRRWERAIGSSRTTPPWRKGGVAAAPPG